MVLQNLQRGLGLHQRLSAIYLVDCYLVTLFHETEDDPVTEESRIYPGLQGRGTTLVKALQDLDSKIPPGLPRDWKLHE